MKYAIEVDTLMAKARKNLDWKQQIKLSVNPEKAERYRKSSEIGNRDECTMCGEYCAIKKIRDSGL
jgi:phosphomethylpyrimidine synthase